MNGHEPVDDDEVLLRRYSDDPAEGHVSRPVRDDATGRSVLDGGAFRFDPDCSVSRARVLDDHEIPHDEIRDPRFARLATLRVVDVRTCSLQLDDGAVVRPYAVRPSPWPRGTIGVPRGDVAHASIDWATKLGRATRRVARDALAEIATAEPDATSR